ncbi:MAG TPA: TIGR04282 family arsenosugar biosynthesis glycosyltransferase [Candidatus Binatia bacterium]|nr:TIGR04282 family arsenosugar biosynthesis glycosyltransferase [Candidatus Binatia bacterium]
MIFARDPVPGAVKTRLARAIGPEAAAELYAAFVEDLAARLAGATDDVRWEIAPPEGGFAERFGIAREACRPQQGADLGDRMRSAFERARREGYGACAIVGSDMPQLAPATVADAFARLAHADLVLGPADDGGYYLIAMREPHEVFSGIPWSTPEVLARTLRRARELGLAVALLARDFDVDDESDVARLRGLLAARPDLAAALPATSRALRTR